jgi:transposase InsO family protein
MTVRALVATEGDTALVATTDDSSIWYLDSGATAHMASDIMWFSTYMALDDHEVLLGDNHRIQVSGRGNIKALHYINGEPQPLLLLNVLHVPAITKNLLSATRLAAVGLTTEITPNGCRVHNQGSNVLHPVLVGRMLVVNLHLPTTRENALAATIKEVPAALLHRRFAHISEQRVRLLMHHHEHRDLKGKQACEVCITTKQTRAPIGDGPAERACKPLERLHSDICGPLPSPTFCGKRYFATIIDDATRYASVYLLTRKSEVTRAFAHFLASAPHDHQCLRLRTDQGGEYMGRAFQNLLAEHGIEHEPTAACTPEHNGVSERYNRTALTMVRGLLAESGLPDRYWGEALNVAVMLNN